MLNNPKKQDIDENILLSSVDKWLDAKVKPHVSKLEHDDTYPSEMVDQMREMGLFGATISQDWGGLGLPSSTYAKIVTKVSEVWMSLTGIFNSHLMMSAAVEKFGTIDQKEKFLPRFASGELRGGLGLTEPDAGTDLQGIRTKAEKKGNE